MHSPYADPLSRSYGLNRDIFDEDLNRERPQWIMSAYGPGRDAPIQLFGGLPLEQSMEEIRVQHYLALIAGNPQQSVGLPATRGLTFRIKKALFTDTNRRNLSRSLQHKRINKLRARLPI